MKIGFIGLGRMGGNMVENLLDKKHDVVIFNRSPEKIAHLVKRKGKKPIASSSVSELIDKLPKQKIIWISTFAFDFNCFFIFKNSTIF